MHQQHTNLHPIKAVGIGPGDPELITLKGLKALEQADVIFYPVTKLEKGNEQSFSRKIIEAYQLSAPLQALLFPMTGENRQGFYKEAFVTIKTAREEGKKVVVVSEGDILFYSTFGYLLEMANQEGVACEMIPGIPAFISGASELKQPLVSGDQTLSIIAAPKTFAQIDEQLNTTDVVVIMKPSVLKGWVQFLSTCQRSFSYIEKVGTNEQFVCNDTKQLIGRTIPYFSIIILGKSKKIETSIKI